LLDSLPDNNLLADEYLTQKLSEMDVTQKRIVKKLTRGIEKKYDLIMKGKRKNIILFKKLCLHLLTVSSSQPCRDEGSSRL